MLFYLITAGPQANIAVIKGVTVKTDFDVLGIGNALMDVILPVDYAFLADYSLQKGSMALIDNDRVAVLGQAFRDVEATPREIAGGSAANTMVGIAELGVRAAYLGKIGTDGVGRRLAKGYQEAGVYFQSTPSRSGAPSGQCLIAVTPDSERTMSTCLGTSAEFSKADVLEADIKRARIVYMEGYLFDKVEAKAAFIKAAEIAKAHGREVSLTLSDSFCVERHHESFVHLVRNHINILFANEAEMLALAKTEDLDAAIDAFTHENLTMCITRSEKGSLIVDGKTRHAVPAIPVTSIVDTTGAGDQYAAGVLAGRALGLSWPDAGYLGSKAAAEVITHYGARPETSVIPLY
ncbi:adenosine kinase [Litorimonas taeanensis]|uniref:Adenosine kinase n=1 Tax=Litorimonas taeanensis TaxID=568099 RepID=A0A420WFF6_9PROT|nr:adenosine kinase [Litorimonas taeanensis]RKQ69695.1 adenosine kinase [Litorimonas taeanensis]